MCGESLTADYRVFRVPHLIVPRDPAHRNRTRYTIPSFLWHSSPVYHLSYCCTAPRVLVRRDVCFLCPRGFAGLASVGPGTYTYIPASIYPSHHRASSSSANRRHANFLVQRALFVWTSHTLLHPVSNCLCDHPARTHAPLILDVSAHCLTTYQKTSVRYHLTLRAFCVRTFADRIPRLAPFRFQVLFYFHYFTLPFSLRRCCYS